MKKVLLLLLAAVASLTAFARTSPLDVREIRLSNGMQVWINQDASQPKVFGAVVVKAGGKDCPDTGLAHYLEHLLFKGTEELGTVDYAAEKVWLDSIALCYNRLSETTAPEERLAIQKEINRLSIAAADYAIPNEFDLLTSRFGGTGLNAATSYDYTFYFNTFSPQYMAQWCELNSHRLIRPVFRLFQGELETVYEEKNRGADNTMQAPLFEMIRVFSDGNPYSYEVIGSTENLKNPRLGEMMDFFHQYYVGNNMGLILSGDIDPDGLEALLESTFGRIPAGEPAHREPVRVPLLQGARDVKIKVEMPMIKIAVYAFNGPEDGHADARALDLATALLSNSFSSGLLDSLATSHKVLMAAASRVPIFNEMGLVGYAIVPSLPFGSLSKAERLCRRQVEKVKAGAFSDTDLEALKLEAARNALLQMETIDGRAEQMISVMSQNRSWADYLSEVEAIRAITREDVIRVANKYFGDNYIRFEKVKGTYPKDKVSAPAFDPIVPRHAGEKSDYAQRLEALPVREKAPRLLDFEADVQRVPLADGVVLYYKENPVDDLFSFTVQIDEGTVEDPLLSHVAAYVNAIGTDSLSVQQLAKAWQHLGTTFSASADQHSFRLDLVGFDAHFAPSVRLLRHVQDHVRGDKAGFKEIRNAIALEKKTFLTGGTSNIMQGALQRVLYGTQAPLLTGLSSKELGAVGMDGLLDAFHGLMRKPCSLFYCGTLPVAEVAAILKDRLDLQPTREAPALQFHEWQQYDRPTVFFYHLPGSRQTQIMTYQTLSAPQDGREAALMELLGEYVGGGMYSLMFQEVREFRSLAYSAFGGTMRPVPVQEDKAVFYTGLGTQADKTLSALQLVDSLLTAFPLKEATFTASAQSIRATANNGYPALRAVPKAIHDNEVQGYRSDPSADILAHIGTLTLQDLQTYYTTVVLPSPRCYILVGDRNVLPMEEVAAFGQVVELTQKDIYK